jgi:hypothetical protein
VTITHKCWYGGEDVEGSQYWYTCHLHDVTWSGPCGPGHYKDYDPDFAANAPSPA